jgi:hypothetical protein
MIVVKPKLLVLEMFTALKKPEEPGLKFVVFRIKAKDLLKGFDYGFANWTGTEWEEVDPSATVIMWATMPNPSILL